jgi:sigma-B regulation protein RsbU (phosphoserine phosphatase)
MQPRPSADYPSSVLASFASNVVSFFSHSGKSAPLPNPVQAEVPALQQAELAALYYGQRMGGDFYDFLRVSPSRVVFGLLDVAGRVEQCQGILSAVQTTFRAVSQELFSQEDVNEADAMVELSIQLNRTILKEAQGVHSCPAFAACYNEDLGVMCYVNSGHTPALLRDRMGVVELGATGLPLGLFSHATSDAGMAALIPGSAMLLVSRGVIEGKSKGEEFGLHRVKRCFQDSTAETAKEFCVTIIDDVKQYMKTAPTHNDVTALSLLRTGVGQASAD